MTLIVGLVVVLGFGWLMYSDLRFRRFGFGVLVLLALGVAGLWYVDQNQSRQFRAERERALTAIGPHELTFRDLQLSQDQLGWRLQGSVLNNSQLPLRALVVQVTLSDCPSPTGDDGCVVIGEHDARFYVEVPPRQARQLDTTIVFNHSPRITQYWAWRYAVKEIEAKLD